MWRIETGPTQLERGPDPAEKDTRDTGDTKGHHLHKASTMPLTEPKYQKVWELRIDDNTEARLQQQQRGKNLEDLLGQENR